MPSIFEFTSSPKKRKADLSMTRYEAAKRRQRCKDKQETGNDLLSENKSVAVQTVITSHSVEVQTDFTMVDLAALEHDCQQRLNEIHTLKEQTNRVISNASKSEEGW